MIYLDTEIYENKIINKYVWQVNINNNSNNVITVQYNFEIIFFIFILGHCLLAKGKRKKYGANKIFGQGWANIIIPPT